MTKTIKESMQKLIEHGTQAKFYQGNIDLFLCYFDNEEQYKALIAAGNFKKMQQIIEAKSDFSRDEFINNQSK